MMQVAIPEAYCPICGIRMFAKNAPGNDYSYSAQYLPHPEDIDCLNKGKRFKLPLVETEEIV
jgi:hypothetical protein